MEIIQTSEGLECHVQGKTESYKFRCREIDKYPYDTILLAPPKRKLVYAFVLNRNFEKPWLIAAGKSDNLFIRFSEIADFEWIKEYRPNYLLFILTKEQDEILHDIRNYEFFNLENLKE